MKPYKTPPQFKTFTGLLNYLKSEHIHDVLMCRYRSLYYVTVGNHAENILFNIDIQNKRIDHVAREDNCEFYNLVGHTISDYPTAAGRENLLTLLNS